MEINSNTVYECGVCYVELNINNSVTTRCNHKFCNTLRFFRWIEANATCPSCRAPIDSNTNLTVEQMQVEASEVYQDYHFHLTQYTRFLQKIVSSAGLLVRAIESYIQYKKWRLTI